MSDTNPPINSRSEQEDTHSSDTTSFEQVMSFEQVTKAHKQWFKRILGLGAIEAKIWVASAAQLIALMCAAAVLLVTAWLLLIATAAVLAWSHGFSLISILSIGVIVSLGSAVALLTFVNRTLAAMSFTRTLDAFIPTDSTQSSQE